MLLQIHDSAVGIILVEKGGQLVLFPLRFPQYLDHGFLAFLFMPEIFFHQVQGFPSLSEQNIVQRFHLGFGQSAFYQVADKSGEVLNGFSVAIEFVSGQAVEFFVFLLGDVKIAVEITNPIRVFHNSSLFFMQKHGEFCNHFLPG